MIPYGGPELAKAFRTVRGNTLAIAEEIPEEQYSFVAAPGTRSVGQLLTHIAVLSEWQSDFHRVNKVTTLKGYDFGALVGRLMAEEQKPRSKREIIDLLKSRGEDFAAWLESLTPAFLAETYTDGTGQSARTRFENIMAAKEHEMHHRGQLMLIQRMIGIVPHLTRQMQERMAARTAQDAKA